jgi:hypothetical protein
VKIATVAKLAAYFTTYCTALKQVLYWLPPSQKLAWIGMTKRPPPCHFFPFWLKEGGASIKMERPIR